MHQRQITECHSDKTEEKRPTLAAMPRCLGFTTHYVVSHLLDHDVEKAVANKFRAGTAECLEYKKMDLHPLNLFKLRQIKTHLVAAKQRWQQAQDEMTRFQQKLSQDAKEKAEMKVECSVSFYPNHADYNLCAKIMLQTGEKSFVTLHDFSTYRTAYTERKQALNLLKYTKEKYNQFLTLMRICRYLPCHLKAFLILLDALPNADKRNFKSLQNGHFEIMFVYNASQKDFIVGIRPRKTYMPHPTIIGGVDPAILAGGTINMTFINNHLKVTAIRGDSGHYQVGSQNLELIGWYIRKEINPVYFGNNGFIPLKSFDSDPAMTKALAIPTCDPFVVSSTRRKRHK